MVYLQEIFVLKMDLSFLPKTNWVDIVVLIFLIRGGYVGLQQGFSVELFKILGAALAAVFSLLFYENIGGWLATHSFISLQVANIISFLVLVFSLLIVFKIVRTLVFKILHLELLGSLERWVGLALGLVRSAILVSLFIFALTLAPIQYIKESVEERSFSGPYIQKVAPEVVHFVVKFKPTSTNNNNEENK